MTIDKPHATDHGIEKQSTRPGDKPPTGTPITDKADNAVQQRSQEREALKAFRLTTDPNNAFAIDMGDGSDVKDRRPIVQTIGALESKQELIALKAPEAVSPTDRPVSGTDLVDIAEKLGNDRHRWESSTTGKCNAFVDAVYRKGHIPLPWDEAHVPDCHGMNEALDKECQKPHSHWHKIYVYDSGHGADSDNRFTQYQPKNGDIIIWDKPFGDKYVQHSGIAVEPYDIKYAGARDQKGKPPKHGIGKTGIENYTQHEPFGAPSVVYRYD